MTLRSLEMLLLAAILPSAADAAARSTPAARRLCPRVTFVGLDPALNESEKRLVCGDPDSDGWKDIPLRQKQEFLTAFLQRRGYHYPKFSIEGTALVVDMGTRTVISKLTGSGLDGIFDLGKRRKIVGQALTPEMLDKTEKAVLFELQSRGRACPAIQTAADARTGEVRVAVDPGPVYRVPPVPPPRLAKLDPVVLDRYRAFDYGEPLDIRMLSLTSERIKQEGLFMSAYYDVACGTAGPSITQHIIEAPPRLMTIGVGADTEGYVRVRARFQNARIGYRASSAETEFNISRLEQSLSANARYYLRPSDRLYLRPAMFARREDEPPYQAAHSQGAFTPSWARDIDGFYLETRGGPTIDYFNTIVGLGPTQDSWLSFITWTQVKTHLYEYHQADPQRGWTATLETMSRIKGAYSAVSADRIRLSGEALWNIGHFHPPIVILATRGYIGTIWLADRPQVFTRLPPPDRFFLGGENDLRGIARKQLPGDQTGFLTAAYDGLEIRAGEIFPFNLQPLIFIDAAMAGTQAYHLDPDVYYSPGFGVRLPLPFGSIRATLARGMTWSRGSVTAPPTPRWQFFFALGREF
jgi:translocation and assembly module TamA